MNLSNLPRSAKEGAEAIAKWCEQAGVAYEFGNGGKHPYVSVTVNRQSRKMPFAGSPGDRRATMAALTQLRSIVRNMGFKDDLPSVNPQMLNALPSKKEEPVKNLSDLKDVVMNTDVPAPPSYAINENGRKFKHDHRYQEAVRARNEWVWTKRRAGVKQVTLLSQLRKAGWIVANETVIDAMSSKHSRAAGLQPAVNYRRTPKAGPVTITRPEPEPEAPPKEKITVTVAPPTPLDGEAGGDFVLRLAAAISPIVMAEVGKMRAELRQYKEKAEKWDAIKGLVKDE